MKQHSFETFIIQCCKAREWDLRTFLKKKLKVSGFTITEDAYLSSRVMGNKKYNKVHNMLAVRGNPRVCLVAHTDVCRDHGFHSAEKTTPDVFPTIKIMKDIDGEEREVIQDKDCNFQVGGDDRLGVAINTWIALNAGYDMALLFTTDEEVGLVSANRVRFEELNTYDLLVQVDRGNYSQQLVTNISGTKLCSTKTAERLLNISKDMGIPRDEVRGMMTDVEVIRRNGVAKEAVNMTCGYHNSFGDSAKEYIDIQEAKDTMRYVSNIIQYYDLRKDEDEPKEEQEEEEGDNIPSKDISFRKNSAQTKSWKEIVIEDFEEDDELDLEVFEGMSIEEYILSLDRPLFKREKRKYILDEFSDGPFDKQWIREYRSLN
jgi:hypothetical protein